MGHNMYEIVPSWDETMKGDNLNKIMLGHNMDKTMMGAPMVQTMLGHNNMDNNIRGSSGTRSTLVFGFPMRGHNTYTSMMGRGMSSSMMGNNMYSNMMGRDMASNMVGQDMPSHTMGSQDMYTNANLMAPVNMMSQKMQIETMPSQSFT